jgi:hypothetical protein
MANSEYLEVLKKGPKAWSAWLKAKSAGFESIPWDYEHEPWDLWQQRRFQKPDLRYADLHGWNLRAVDFTYANLQAANLTGAELSFAYMADANLKGANLSGANLGQADLRRANLFGANLTGANLSQAIISNTLFISASLDGAKGLETCQHEGPSYLDFRTLQESGTLPDIFLRGCGLPEDFISYLPEFLKQPFQFYSCFISYSHEDKAFARLLHDRLQGQGIRCWLDEHQLLPGDDLYDRIDQGIRFWDKVLLCASKSSLTSWWVDGEINRAFQKEVLIMKERGKKVLSLISLNLDGFLFSTGYQSGKKPEIKSRVAANFVGWERDHALFDRELERIIRALRTDDGGREMPPKPRL